MLADAPELDSPARLSILRRSVAHWACPKSAQNKKRLRRGRSRLFSSETSAIGVWFLVTQCLASMRHKTVGTTRKEYYTFHFFRQEHKEHLQSNCSKGIICLVPRVLYPKPDMRCSMSRHLLASTVLSISLWLICQPIASAQNGDLFDYQGNHKAQNLGTIPCDDILSKLEEYWKDTSERAVPGLSGGTCFNIHIPEIYNDLSEYVGIEMGLAHGHSIGDTLDVTHFVYITSASTRLHIFLITRHPLKKMESKPPDIPRAFVM